MSRTFTIDVEAVRGFIESHVPGYATADVEIRRHSGGHSCETWQVRCNGERWILRRPPRGDVQKGASNMAREYRIIAALADTPVPVPRAIALCEDAGVIGSPFFLMEEVDGVVLRFEFPADLPGTPDRRKALGESLVDTLVDIHAVDWKAVGLKEHGRPENFFERNLTLMREQWNAVRQRPIDAIETVGAYLVAHIPERGDATIVHGDYKLDNVMWKRECLATPAAVLDWEISTIADPLIDLGWLRGFWCDAGQSRSVVTMAPMLQEQGGFLSRDALVERYADKSGRDVRNVAWYEAFGMWKIAIILEASYKRYLEGHSDDPLFAAFEVIVPALADAALGALREARLV